MFLNKNYFKMLLVALMATSSLALADWTEEYSGDTSDSGEYSSEEAHYVAQWCKSTSRILRAELNKAKEHLAYDELAKSKAVLVAGLRKASASYKDTRKVKPMTKKLLERVGKYLDVVNNLKWDVPERLKLISQLHFLVEYTELIIQTEKNLDSPYHIPYHYNHGGCRRGCDFDVLSYETAFVNHMRSELNFVVDTFTFYGTNDNYGPIGTPEIYLKISQILSAGVAKDLSENLHRYRNACAVRDLRHLSRVLNGYNYNNDKSYFRSEPVAVDKTTERLLHAASSIQPNNDSSLAYAPTYGGSDYAGSHHEGSTHHTYGCRY